MTETNTEVWKLRPFAPASGHRLGLLSEIPDGGAKEYVLGVGVNAFKMFVVRKGDEAFAYLNICPHYSLPLNHRADEFLSRDGTRIMCRQHLALFRLEDGACLDGACEGRALDSVPVRIEQDWIVVN